MIPYCCMNQKQLETLKQNNYESRDFARSCFSFALMIMLKENNGFTVSKLCSLAGVSRTAFYRNYTCVEDVLDDRLKEISLSIARQITTDVYDNWLLIFSTVEKYMAQLEVIVNAGFGYKLYDVFMSLLPKDEENKEIQSIWLSLFYTYIVRWIKERKPKKVEDAARMAYKYTKNIPLVKA